MPTIELSLSDLEVLLKRKLPHKEDDLNETLQYVKAAVENLQGDVLTIGLEDGNRPDLWSAEGIARALHGFYKTQKGLPVYKTRSAGYQVVVDRKIKTVRPYIACAVVKGVKLNDVVIKQLMQYQDKIDGTFGRGRKKSSIGLYNFDLLKFPLHYSVTKLNENAFKPLGFERMMTPEEILKDHPKGKEYGEILKGQKEVPIFKDSMGKVLSLPPIINSNDLGKIGSEAKNILVEVTGTDIKTVNAVLEMFASALADRSGEIFEVKINYPYTVDNEYKNTPRFSNKRMMLDLEKANKLIGITIRPQEAARLLESARHGASVKGNSIDVTVPFYRNDVMHTVDLIEDLAIMVGYNKIEPMQPALPTVGGLSNAERISDRVRELGIGLECQEVLNFTLSNKRDLFEKMNAPEQKSVDIENPVSLEFTTFRNALLPGLMRFLSENRSNEFPQQIFEVGGCADFDALSETGTKVTNHFSAALSYDRCNFTHIKSFAEALLKQLHVTGRDGEAHGMRAKYEIRELKHPSFIETRCAEILVRKKPVGIFGEIHPQVLQNWKLEMPVIALEIDLEKLV